MSDTAAPPAFQTLDEIAPKRRPIQREWALQRGVRRFVKRAVACEHEFACHDRGQKRSEMEHIYEATRGIRRDWPDTELDYTEGRTFRCELKRAGVMFDWTSGQGRLLRKLERLGHGSAAATTVAEYGAEAERAGVPLVPHWRMIARHEDEAVAGDIRDQEARAEKKRGGYVAKSKPRARISLAQAKRGNAFTAKRLGIG